NNFLTPRENAFNRSSSPAWQQKLRWISLTEHSPPGTPSASLLGYLTRHFFKLQRSGYRQTILYAEDSDKTAKRVIKYLNKNGYYVIRVLNALQAMYVLEKWKCELGIAVLVTDNYMPRKNDGIGLVKYVRNELNDDSLPVIIFSKTAFRIDAELLKELKSAAVTKLFGGKRRLINYLRQVILQNQDTSPWLVGPGPAANPSSSSLLSEIPVCASVAVIGGSLSISRREFVRLGLAGLGLLSLGGCATQTSGLGAVKDILQLSSNGRKHRIFIQKLLGILRENGVNVEIAYTPQEWERFCREQKAKSNAAFYNHKNNAMFVFVKFVSPKVIAHECVHALQKNFVFGLRKSNPFISYFELIERLIEDTSDLGLKALFNDIMCYLCCDHNNPIKAIWYDYRIGLDDQAKAKGSLRALFRNGISSEFISDILNAQEFALNDLFLRIEFLRNIAQDEFFAYVYSSAINFDMPLNFELTAGEHAALKQANHSYPSVNRLSPNAATEELVRRIQTYPQIKETLRRYYREILGLPVPSALQSGSNLASSPIDIELEGIKVVLFSLMRNWKVRIEITVREMKLPPQLPPVLVREDNDTDLVELIRSLTEIYAPVSNNIWPAANGIGAFAIAGAFLKSIEGWLSENTTNGRLSDTEAVAIRTQLDLMRQELKDRSHGAVVSGLFMQRKGNASSPMQNPLSQPVHSNPLPAKAREIILLHLQGKSYEEVMFICKIARKTLYWHVNSINSILGTQGKLSLDKAAKIAVEKGYVECDPLVYAAFLRRTAKRLTLSEKIILVLQGLGLSRVKVKELSGLAALASIKGLNRFMRIKLGIGEWQKGKSMNEVLQAAIEQGAIASQEAVAISLRYADSIPGFENNLPAFLELIGVDNDSFTETRRIQNKVLDEKKPGPRAEAAAERLIIEGILLITGKDVRKTAEFLGVSLRELRINVRNYKINPGAISRLNVSEGVSLLAESKKDINIILAHNRLVVILKKRLLAEINASGFLRIYTRISPDKIRECSRIVNIFGVDILKLLFGKNLIKFWNAAISSPMVAKGPQFDPCFIKKNFTKVFNSKAASSALAENGKRPQLIELELKLLSLVASNKDTAEICAITGRTSREISRTFENIYRKLGMAGKVQVRSKRAPSRVEAALYAMELGIIGYTEAIESAKNRVNNPLTEKQRAILMLLLQQGACSETVKQVLADTLATKPSSIEKCFVQINATLKTSLGRLSPFFPQSIWASVIIAAHKGYIEFTQAEYDVFVCNYIELLLKWLQRNTGELRAVLKREGVSEEFIGRAQKITTVLKRLDKIIEIIAYHPQAKLLRTLQTGFEYVSTFHQQVMGNNKTLKYEELQQVLRKHNIQFYLGDSAEEVAPVYADLLALYLSSLPDKTQQEVRNELGIDSFTGLKRLLFGKRLEYHHWQLQNSGLLLWKNKPRVRLSHLNREKVLIEELDGKIISEIIVLMDNKPVPLALAYDRTGGELIFEFIAISEKRLDELGDGVIKQFQINPSGVVTLGSEVVCALGKDFSGVWIEIEVRKSNLRARAVSIIFICNEQGEPFPFLNGHPQRIDLRGDVRRQLDRIVLPFGQALGKRTQVYDAQGNLVKAFGQIHDTDFISLISEIGEGFLVTRLDNLGKAHLGGKGRNVSARHKNQTVQIFFQNKQLTRVIFPDDIPEIDLSKKQTVTGVLASSKKAYLKQLAQKAASRKAYLKSERRWQKQLRAIWKKNNLLIRRQMASGIKQQGVQEKASRNYLRSERRWQRQVRAIWKKNSLLIKREMALDIKHRKHDQQRMKDREKQVLQIAGYKYIGRSEISGLFLTALLDNKVQEAFSGEIISYLFPNPRGLRPGERAARIRGFQDFFEPKELRKLSLLLFNDKPIRINLQKAVGKIQEGISLFKAGNGHIRPLTDKEIVVLVSRGCSFATFEQLIGHGGLSIAAAVTAVKSHTNYRVYLMNFSARVDHFERKYGFSRTVISRITGSLKKPDTRLRQIREMQQRYPMVPQGVVLHIMSRHYAQREKLLSELETFAQEYNLPYNVAFGIMLFAGIPQEELPLLIIETAYLYEDMERVFQREFDIFLDHLAALTKDITHSPPQNATEAARLKALIGQVPNWRARDILRWDLKYKWMRMILAAYQNKSYIYRPIEDNPQVRESAEKIINIRSHLNDSAALLRKKAGVLKKVLGQISRHKIPAARFCDYKNYKFVIAQELTRRLLKSEAISGILGKKNLEALGRRITNVYVNRIYGGHKEALNLYFRRGLFREENFVKADFEGWIGTITNDLKKMQKAGFSNTIIAEALYYGWSCESVINIQAEYPGIKYDDLCDILKSKITPAHILAKYGPSGQELISAAATLNRLLNAGTGSSPVEASKLNRPQPSRYINTG
ncbi:MAG: hypothetical protein PHC54_06805, partial [Candidatus Omnitrophica bacterium]|nr:hypothetical protein [Candidatus Omnitrophota bacterium]